MRINRLKLIDWRNVAELDITLDRLAVIRGPNHSGKSSIKQAIEFALTGRCESTNAKGDGGAALIRQGAEKGAKILMKLQASKEVDLKCSLTASSGRDVTVTDPNDAGWNGAGVKQWLASQREVLSCLLNSRYFLDLGKAGQKKLLSSVILPESYAWPHNITTDMARLNLRVNWDQAPLDVLEQARTLAFDRRRDVNRDLKNLLIPKALPRPEGAVGSLDELRSQLSESRALLGRMEKAHRQAVTDYGKSRAEVVAVQTRIAALTARIREQEETVTDATLHTLSVASLKACTKTADGEAKYAELERDKGAADEQVAGIKAVIRIFDELDGKECCPLCRREVTPEWLLGALKPQKEALDKALRRQKDIIDAMKALGDIEGAKRKIEDHNRAADLMKRAKAQIADSAKQLANLKEELDGARAKECEDPGDFETAEVRELRAKIGTLESALSEVAVAEAREKEIAAAKQQQAQLSEASRVLDELVTYFGSDVVKVTLRQGPFGDFVNSINDALAPWGYACAFEIEPYGFRVTNVGTGATLPLELLSGSERLRFAVAFQVALAQVTNIRMVVVDEVDTLDAEGRGGLFPLLLESDLDQAIAIGTDEREEVPEVDGAVFYAMQGGKALAL